MEYRLRAACPRFRVKDMDALVRKENYLMKKLLGRKITSYLQVNELLSCLETLSRGVLKSSAS